MSAPKTAVALFVTGCEVEQQNDSPSPLAGTWLTDACDQMAAEVTDIDFEKCLTRV